MKQKQSLRLIDNSEVLQDIVQDRAFLFAQFAMAEARRNNLDTKQLVEELEGGKESKIILL